MKTAVQPFEFITAGYVTRIGNQIAHNLGTFVTGIEECSDLSIFHHTFQTLGRHHFLTEGFSNDFAQWVLSATNREELAEQLAAIDVRDYVSLAELRSDLRRVACEYCRAHPNFAEQEALEPFYFCESIEATLPFGLEAHTLDEFQSGLQKVSHASFHYHFISSRLRLQLRTNDFSWWLAKSMGLEALASKVDKIDIYTNTIDSARTTLLRLIDRERTNNDSGNN